MDLTDKSFRDRFLTGDRLFGSFLKVPATMPAEILGSVGFDFVVIDEEHAPFNRETTDRIILACKAFGPAAIVRVQSNDPAQILSVLDCGADGILVPHITDAETARSIVAAARYRGGKRGFAPTTRAGHFGAASMADHIASEDARVTVVAMIEDPEAIGNIDDILSVDGLDGVFIGRGDLGAAFSEFDNGPDRVKAATLTVQAAARKRGKTVAVLPGSTSDAEQLASDGATVFLLSSDQGFLKSAASATLGAMSGAVAKAGKA